MMDFTTEKFSGPLGLLLTLIESEEMDITEVSLAKIADEYVNYIRGAKDIDPEELADFLVVAAKLLYIKSKALLPYLSTIEDEAEIDDLTKQLRMYKEFVEASGRIKSLIALKKWLYLPPLTKNRRGQFSLPIFSPPVKINPLVLHQQFLKILFNLAKQQETKLPEETLEPKISIDEKILLIKAMIINKVRVNFSKLLAAAATKTEVIVNFLAVLELVKQQELIFEQEELFSEIHISRHT
ncbi:MAG: segregation/condensation protein A [Patescibacteria group bacterium]|jgi:segregation and condensation protein A